MHARKTRVMSTLPLERHFLQLHVIGADSSLPRALDTYPTDGIYSPLQQSASQAWHASPSSGLSSPHRVIQRKP